MKFLCFNVVSTGLCIVIIVANFAVLAARGKPKAKIKKYEIAFNNSYYTSRYSPCKKGRMFNPVETFRAQGYAAGIYRKCGPRIVMEICSKYKFPAYGEAQTYNSLSNTVAYPGGAIGRSSPLDFSAWETRLLTFTDTTKNLFLEYITHLSFVSRRSRLGS